MGEERNKPFIKKWANDILDIAIKEVFDEDWNECCTLEQDKTACSKQNRHREGIITQGEDAQYEEIVKKTDEKEQLPIDQNRKDNKGVEKKYDEQERIQERIEEGDGKELEHEMETTEENQKLIKCTEEGTLKEKEQEEKEKYINPAVYAQQGGERKNPWREEEEIKGLESKDIEERQEICVEATKRQEVCIENVNDEKIGKGKGIKNEENRCINDIPDINIEVKNEEGYRQLHEEREQETEGAKYVKEEDNCNTVVIDNERCARKESGEEENDRDVEKETNKGGKRKEEIEAVNRKFQTELKEGQSFNPTEDATKNQEECKSYEKVTHNERCKEKEIDDKKCDGNIDEDRKGDEEEKGGEKTQKEEDNKNQVEEEKEFRPVETGENQTENDTHVEEDEDNDVDMHEEKFEQTARKELNVTQEMVRQEPVEEYENNPLKDLKGGDGGDEGDVQKQPGGKGHTEKRKQRSEIKNKKVIDEELKGGTCEGDSTANIGIKKEEQRTRWWRRMTRGTPSRRALNFWARLFCCCGNEDGEE